MKYINLMVAILMGASLAFAAPTLEENTIQDLAGSLDAVASAFFKTLNNSVPGPGPESTSTPALFDGGLIKTRDPSKVLCDVWVNDNDMLKTQPYKVVNNIEKLRGRSDKPPTVGHNDCKRAICDQNSGIIWCTNAKNPYTVDSWDAIADAAQAAMDSCSSQDVKDGMFDAAVFYDNDAWLAGISYCD